MVKFLVLLPITLLVFLAACKPVPPGSSDSSSSSSVPSPVDIVTSSSSSETISSSQESLAAVASSSTAPVAMAKGAYSAFHDGVIGNERAVLFFHAPWCPTCRSADSFLQGLYRNGPPDISVYKVDYDSETVLKQRYGVVTQHTFVAIDEQGNKISSLLGPSNEKLQQFLQ